MARIVQLPPFRNIDDSPILYYFKGTRACIIGHCSIIKTNNKKQQIFLMIPWKSYQYINKLPVRRYKNSAKARTGLYCFTFYRSRMTGPTTLRHRLKFVRHYETVWDNVWQCLETMRQFETVSHCLKTLSYTVSMSWVNISKKTNSQILSGDNAQATVLACMHVLQSSNAGLLS
jgi:hypothetical protein